MKILRFSHPVYAAALFLFFAEGSYAYAAGASGNCFSLADTSNVMALTPDWAYDFEQGWNAQYGQGGLANRNPAAAEWRYAQMQTNEAGVTVSDPKAPQNQVIQFLWQKGEGTQYDSNTQKKAHLYGEFGASNSEEEIWSFDVLFPTIGMQSDPQPAIIAQWHGVPDANEAFRRPPIAVDNKNDRLTLSWLYDDREITPAGFDAWDVSSRDLGVTTKDEWINFVFHIKFDPWGDGALKVFRDGQLLVDESQIAIGFNDLVGSYLGFGIYQFTGDSLYDQRSIYFDNMRQWVVEPGVPLLTADFDCNGVVDGVDLETWEAGFPTGTTHAQGDVDLDDDVDGADFLAWQQQFNLTAPSVGSSLAVPEPDAIFLAIVTGFFALLTTTRNPGKACSYDGTGDPRAIPQNM